MEPSSDWFELHHFAKLNARQSLVMRLSSAQSIAISSLTMMSESFLFSNAKKCPNLEFHSFSHSPRMSEQRSWRKWVRRLSDRAIGRFFLPLSDSASFLSISQMTFTLVCPKHGALEDHDVTWTIRTSMASFVSISLYILSWTSAYAAFYSAAMWAKKSFESNLLWLSVVMEIITSSENNERSLHVHENLKLRLCNN